MNKYPASTLAFDKHRDNIRYLTDSSYDTDSSFLNLNFTTAIMSRAQSPVRAPSPSRSTDELLGRVLNQMEALTISFTALKRENENRIKEISKLSKKIGGVGTVETDNEFQRRREVTDDHSTDEEIPERQENIYVQPQFTQVPLPTAPQEERKMGAKLAIETIKTINGQDDMGVEDFIKIDKRARLRCEKPEILLDLILAKKITGTAEKAIRYMQIKRRFIRSIKTKFKTN